MYPFYMSPLDMLHNQQDIYGTLVNFLDGSVEVTLKSMAMPWIWKYFTSLKLNMVGIKAFDDSFISDWIDNFFTIWLLDSGQQLSQARHFSLKNNICDIRQLSLFPKTTPTHTFWFLCSERTPLTCWNLPYPFDGYQPEVVWGPCLEVLPGEVNAGLSVIKPCGLMGLFWGRICWYCDTGCPWRWWFPWMFRA